MFFQNRNLSGISYSINNHVLQFLPFYLVAYLSSSNRQNYPQQFFYGSKNLFKAKNTINPKLQTIFADEIANFPGRWAVVVKDLKTQHAYQFNENEIFVSASLYKLAVMFAVFDEIENGQLKLDDAIGNTTIEDALNAMITISDNETALALAEKIGWTKIDDLMANFGMPGIDLISENGPYTDAASMVTLLERIYKKSAVSPNASVKMKELLLQQQINDRIPKYLPPGVKVAHKTGEIDSLRHDAAIVLGKKSDYIFVFLADTNLPGETPEVIAQLSKKIYDTLENQ